MSLCPTHNLPRRRSSRCSECQAAIVRKWNAEHPGANGAHVMRWRAANKEKARLLRRRYKFNRRARVRGAFVEDVDPATVYERDKGICHICGKPTDSRVYSLDHVVALANGGEHSYANVKLAHLRCNSVKGARY